MLRKVLLPLDGSKPANSIIPFVHSLVDNNCELFLLTVLNNDEEVRDMTSSLKMVHGCDTGSFKNTKIMKVRTIVKTGNPSSEIMQQAEELKVDSIALSTHGDTGLFSMALGSVSQAVINSTKLPLLLYKPGRKGIGLTPKTYQSKGLKKILVPLDGSQMSEKAIDPAVLIAKKCASEIVFLRIGDGSYWENGSASFMDHSRTQDSDAHKYLKNCVSRASKNGVPNCSYVYSRGDPMDRVWRSTVKTNSDIVISGTKRDKGPNWFTGTFLENIIKNVSIPLLLV